MRKVNSKLDDAAPENSHNNVLKNIVTRQAQNAHEQRSYKQKDGDQNEHNRRNVNIN